MESVFQVTRLLQAF